MATDDANPDRADPEPPRPGSSTSTPRPAATGASSTSTTWRACARRIPRCSPSAPVRLALVGEGLVDGLRARPSRRARRPCGLPGAPPRRRRRARLAGEDPAPRRVAARLARRGHGRLRVPQRRGRAVRRSGGAGAAHRAVGRSPPPSPFDALGRRGAARAGAHHLRAVTSSRPRRKLLDGRGARAGARGAARLPHLCGRDGVARRRPARAREEGRAPGATCSHRRHAALVTRFQQTSPPITAKGIEDTAFYRHLRLLALNDVGGDPARFGRSTSTPFHAANAARARGFPLGLLVSQTHDTKRSGDVRARIGALGAMAEEWAGQVRPGARWPGRCAEAGRPTRTRSCPTLQTLVGAWPIQPERLCGYLEKALREAKRAAAGRSPTRPGRRAAGYCRALSSRRRPDGVRAVAERVAVEVGELPALRQPPLKLTGPGVPDVYQGDELVALTLVDPDNRWPVDWERGGVLREELREGKAPAAATRASSTSSAALLALRARRPAAFAGDYAPLDAGPGVVAFLRGDAVAVALPIREGGKLDTDLLALPAGRLAPGVRPGVARRRRDHGARAGLSASRAASSRRRATASCWRPARAISLSIRAAVAVVGRLSPAAPATAAACRGSRSRASRARRTASAASAGSARR